MSLSLRERLPLMLLRFLERAHELRVEAVSVPQQSCREGLRLVHHRPLPAVADQGTLVDHPFTGLEVNVLHVPHRGDDRR